MNRFNRNLKSFKIVPLATKSLFGLDWLYLISCDFNKMGSNFWTHKETSKVIAKSGKDKYSKLSIKRPVLLNDLVWIFSKKSQLKNKVHLRKKSILLFHFRATMANFWALLNNQVNLRKNPSYVFISGLPRPIFGLY